MTTLRYIYAMPQKPKKPKAQTTDSAASWSARAVRVARVAGAAAGVATQMAGNTAVQMATGTPGAGKNAAAIRAALGNLRGPIMKVAQLLATIPDALPDEYVAELRQLQSSAPPMGWAFVRRRMEAALGAGWLSRFQHFERTAAHAASLGQVHRGVGMDGTPLACKLQYPDLANVIEADLGQLKLLMRLFEQFDSSVRVGDAHTEIAARLREELDYAREGRVMTLYGEMLRGETGVRVPVWQQALSTRELLTMTWLDGAPLMDFAQSSQQQRNAIAHHLFRAWYVPFYQYGIIHGDPHLGNYTIGAGNVINLLDFGCIRIFDASFVGGVINLYHALARNDDDLAVAAYETWGFKNLTRAHVAVLNIWARFLYGPLLDDRARLIGELDGTGVYGRETAQKVHAELRALGGVAIPPAFVFMDRAALGLGSVFLHLRANLNWHDMFHALVAGFDEAALRARQEETLRAAGLADELKG